MIIKCTENVLFYLEQGSFNTVSLPVGRLKWVAKIVSIHMCIQSTSHNLFHKLGYVGKVRDRSEVPKLLRIEPRLLQQRVYCGLFEGMRHYSSLKGSVYNIIYININISASSSFSFTIPQYYGILEVAEVERFIYYKIYCLLFASAFQIYLILIIAADCMI